MRQPAPDLQPYGFRICHRNVVQRPEVRDMLEHHHHDLGRKPGDHIHGHRTTKTDVLACGE